LLHFQVLICSDRIRAQHRLATRPRLLHVLDLLQSAERRHVFRGRLLHARAVRLDDRQDLLLHLEPVVGSYRLVALGCHLTNPLRFLHRFRLESVERYVPQGLLFHARTVVDLELRQHLLVDLEVVVGARGTTLLAHALNAHLRRLRNLLLGQPADDEIGHLALLARTLLRLDHRKSLPLDFVIGVGSRRGAHQFLRANLLRFLLFEPFFETHQRFALLQGNVFDAGTIRRRQFGQPAEMNLLRFASLHSATLFLQLSQFHGHVVVANDLGRFVVVLQRGRSVVASIATQQVVTRLSFQKALAAPSLRCRLADVLVELIHPSQILLFEHALHQGLVFLLLLQQRGTRPSGEARAQRQFGSFGLDPRLGRRFLRLVATRTVVHLVHVDAFRRALLVQRHLLRVLVSRVLFLRLVTAVLLVLAVVEFLLLPVHLAGSRGGHRRVDDLAALLERRRAVQVVVGTVRLQIPWLEMDEQVLLLVLLHLLHVFQHVVVVPVVARPVGQLVDRVALLVLLLSCVLVLELFRGVPHRQVRCRGEIVPAGGSRFFFDFVLQFFFLIFVATFYRGDNLTLLPPTKTIHFTSQILQRLRDLPDLEQAVVSFVSRLLLRGLRVGPVLLLATLFV
jgi:hypothetical protein